MDSRESLEGMSQLGRICCSFRVFRAFCAPLSAPFASSYWHFCMIYKKVKCKARSINSSINSSKSSARCNPGNAKDNQSSVRSNAIRVRSKQSSVRSNTIRTRNKQSSVRNNTIRDRNDKSRAWMNFRCSASFLSPALCRSFHCQYAGIRTDGFIT